MLSVASISVWYRSVKCPYGLCLCLRYLREPKNFYRSLTTGVTPDEFSTFQLHLKREVNEGLCIEEVGVNLELCVHAHGPDVELIMEAARKNNSPL